MTTAKDPESGENFWYFWGSSSPFSQWHRCAFERGGHEFCTAEQWMMAQKAFCFGDDIHLAKILGTRNPKMQKIFGRKVVGYTDVRWHPWRWPAVYLGNYYKFSGPLGAELIATQGYTLVEASPTDKIWGIGWAETAPEAQSRKLWRGANLLGRVLTQVREDMLSGRAEAQSLQYAQEIQLNEFEAKLRALKEAA